MKKLIPVLLLMLSSCRLVEAFKPISPTATGVPHDNIALPIATSTLNPATTETPIPQSPSPNPPEPDPTLTAGWQEVEGALAEKLMADDLKRGPVLCEWAYLGRKDLEIYLYVECKATVPLTEDDHLLPGLDIPAVVRFSPQGGISEIAIPGAGSLYAKDIRRLFPPAVQERIINHKINTRALHQHLLERLQNPDLPPLYITRITPQP